MAISFPHEVPRSMHRNSIEVEAFLKFRDGLRDDWIIFPNLVLGRVLGGSQRELDMLLMHRRHGILIAEVKGAPIEVRDGRLAYAHREERVEGPEAQLEAEKQAFVDRFKKFDQGLYNKVGTLFVVPGQLRGEFSGTTEIAPAQIIGREQLDEIEDAIWEARSVQRIYSSIDEEVFDAILAELGKEFSFPVSPHALRELAKDRRNEALRSELRALETLDRNPRVLVTGAAGTGKTRLTIRWAERAAGEGRSVLWTCYNDPLAGSVREEVEGRLKGVTAEPFLRFILRKLDEAGHGIGPGDEQDPAYWDRVVARAANSHQHLRDRYQTVIVDEVQDFNPVWLTIVNNLVDWSNDGRLLVVGDPRQDLRGMGGGYFGDGGAWTRAELLTNYRNGPEIARLLRYSVFGAGAPNREPYGEEVRIIEIGPSDDLGVAVDEEVRHLVGLGENPWVIVPDRLTRNLLRDRHNQLTAASQVDAPTELHPWEGRRHGVVCETVNRSKGLEAESVVLVLRDDESWTDEVVGQYLYSGVSRAVSRLTVLCGPRVARRLEAFMARKQWG